jgi:hypothetical protein
MNGYYWDINGIFMGYYWDITGIFMGEWKYDIMNGRINRDYGNCWENFYRDYGKEYGNQYQYN